MHSCEYCGTPVISSRKLNKKDFQKIHWIGRILDTRIWKKSFKEHLFYFIQYLLYFLIFEIFFIAFFSYANLPLYIPIGLLSFWNLLAYLAYKEELEYYFDEKAKKKVYQQYIKEVLEEFLRGNNYYRYDFETVLNAKESEYGLM